ncbi:MAG: 16S rRNA (uracil(1498)-N(3))-methyltransferase [Caldilineaceae bacterium]|nr:16S rRNA (uracil(1498)-N(3))-methyltransferase [Caldilineaceae bacterium]MBP8109554.1 16S rRNA (uracil(1498)-N(3))-methyltransferase [Caldilineaceae bacterium]MBP8125391.1 16S rRNA (uracil(1498)-N(3))-methyltransferase [Caldilineaceae bacterium]MBP9074561.1 16S rRNA (uracil(1498)-N(3))-methyltransferase [Caldilineaceae bacterium]
MHRFFLTDTPIQPGAPVDLTPIVHQVRAVLRLGVGDHVVLLDNRGGAFLAEIRALDRKSAQGFVLESVAISGEPTVAVTLFQCSLKADKFEWVLQKGTELGVTRFVPVVSRRSVVRPVAALAKKAERWQAIIREAAEQCGRGRLPVLADPVEFVEALPVAEAHTPCFLPWEEAAIGSRSLGAVLDPKKDRAVNLLIGPEGGLDPAEVALAQAAGWQIVTLGPRILRAETAALAGVTVIMERLGQLSSIP